ncbi:NAD+ kinase [Natranaerovirga hydrolytica]|uniref:NAD kinase n=1 Tax=Natranaerovirga hydrolytica TaxID=680378 RepID=A0A4V2Q1N8_9FIRM|nr:NAD(+)/NADH kinase [Natranaerovirga hydrolytica]TCK98351.1 NAD+ kinase [Natranaerovirga hydrolytica]
MENFGILTNRKKDVDFEMSKNISKWLENNNKTVVLSTELLESSEEEQAKSLDEDLYKIMDCAIILGGDGTIIHSARKLAMYNVPIIGVNLGNLGFLAEVEKKDAFNVLEKIIENDYVIESRMMLTAEIHREEKKPIQAGIGLNDVVITRGGFSRVIVLSVYVNGQLIDTYHSDGLIISTPTGSTAYSLSAGGPILNPTTEMMVITPICPHSLTARSIVVSGDDEVSLVVENFRNKDDGDVLLTIDGQIGHKLNQKDKIIIRRSKYKTKLLKLKDNNYYTLLRKKIGGTLKERKDQ